MLPPAANVRQYAHLLNIATFVTLICMIAKYSNFALVDTQDAASDLGVSVSTVIRKVAAGQLVPAMKAPGKRGAFFFDRAEVERVRTEDASETDALK